MMMIKINTHTLHTDTLTHSHTYSDELFMGDVLGLSPNPLGSIPVPVW